MTNVTSLRPALAAALFDFDLENSRAIFPVASRSLQIVGKQSGKTVPVSSHKAIVRPDPDRDGEIIELGIVGADYKILPNRMFFGAIESTLREHIRPDLLKGATVKDHVSYDGAWCKREYIFPEFAHTLRHSTGLSTKLGYRVIAYNSYDGSSKAGMLTGLIDFWCTNGVISGSLVGQQMRRHTSGLNTDLFAGTIQDSLHQVQDEVRRIEAAAATPLDFAKAAQLLKDQFSERRAEGLADQVKREIEARGSNVWALQSALTWYASHADGAFTVRNTGADNVAKTLHERELEVQRVTHSAQFQALLRQAA
jgi:hypothetical protein